MEPFPFHSEQELLLKLAQGDERAFAVVYRQYYASLFLYAQKIAMKETAIAQDATAEAFIALWRAKKQFENAGHLVGFLRSVVYNKCVDKYRELRREAAIHNELLYLTDTQQDDLFVNKVLLEATLLSRIKEEIEKLPAHTKEVFKLSFFERLKNDEIANRLGIANATVRRRKTEALHYLRKVFHGFNWETLGVVAAALINFKKS